MLNSVRFEDSQALKLNVDGLSYNTVAMAIRK